MRYSVFFFLTLCFTLSQAQSKKSKGDDYYFSYAYKQAVEEYQKELKKEPLSYKQQLNLAHSYNKIGNHKKAAEYYSKVFEQDSIMPNLQFNLMLQSIAITSNVSEVQNLMASEKANLSAETIENALFNYDILQTTLDQQENYELFNLGINSPQADFSPSFYEEDKLLFTSSKPQKKKETYAPSGESYLDIYVSRIGANGSVVSSNVFTALPSSKFHKATPFYSKDLKQVFYVLSNEDQGHLTFNENGKNALAIGVSNENGQFEFLLRDINTSFYYPFYDVASQKLYFAANFEDSYGGTDIYYVHTNNGQIMSAPVNLGPRINSIGNEVSPFIFENTLYFSSDIFYGNGGMDIYKSNFLSDNTLSVPVNLGKGINSAEDDFGFILKNKEEGDGILGYFASNRKGGKGGDDIYGVHVSEKPGLKTIAVKGKVTKPLSTTVIADATVKILDDKGKLLKELQTDASGSYRFEIPYVNELHVEVFKNQYSKYEKIFNSEEIKEIENNGLAVGLAYLDDFVWDQEEQKVLKLERFFFDRNSYKINPIIVAELNKVVKVIKQFPQLKLRVESYTDSRGSEKFNLQLSENRSKAIRDYLISQGVSEDNLLQPVGYGEGKILNHCTNGVFCLDFLHKRNERSYIVVANYRQLF